ncbi:hypothetical protein KZZ52_55745 [Dactylosporangium sp. AC04546]|uniref:hypothetical protein n=1 Tax=Dactylosporangium sp. AC04546 TaxID=2862460 RepID=UPI001EE05104|nr:hypothetical protein [Dactylosporangium sp. AC04546]WVK83080.1 hypothetical protein KZZ52_55745 [Dactylosporangium sp. AC04546]
MKRILTVGAVAVLGAGVLGCGIVNQVKQAVDNVSAITDLADRLGKSSQLTFTAEYKTDDGATTTVVQQPPKAAYLGKDGRFILTEDALYSCTGPANKVVCQKSPVQTGSLSAADQSAYLSAVAGGGFISTEMALGLMTAAAVVPGVKIAQNTATIAGQKSDCLDVTGIPQDKDPSAVTAREFHVCVAENGLLTRFKGVGTDDKALGVELTKFSGDVDPKAFVPPKGAKIVEASAPPGTGN